MIITNALSKHKIKILIALSLIGLLFLGRSIARKDNRHELREVSQQKQIYPPAAPALYTTAKLENQCGVGCSEEALWRRINDYRNSMGGPSLHRNESLCKLAVARAQEVTLPLSHEGVHSVFHQRTFTTYCPLCDILGENLAHVFSIRSLPNLWVKSPEHKKLLEGPYNIGCVKIKEDSDNYYYVVLIVGKVY